MRKRPTRFGRRVALFALLAISGLCGTAGSASALPYFQASYPATPPKGVVLLIHGGGWLYTGPSEVQSLAPQVAQFLADGWATVNTDYSPLVGSLPDVVAVYDAIRRSVGPAFPICVYGQSAGGSLALLVAEQRPVSCVIDAAGPTDLGALENSAADYFVDLLEAAGVANVAWSPVMQAAQRLTAPTLAEYASYDWLVPLSQGQELRQNDPSHVELLTLAPGNQTFVHSAVNPGDLGFVHAQENALLAAVAAGVAPTAPARTAGAPPCQRRRVGRRARHRTRHTSGHRRGSHRMRSRRAAARGTAC
jgi:acetyl esterase/lipase